MPIPRPQQMFNHDTDLIQIGSEVYVRVQIISDICTAIDGIIRQAAGNTTDPLDLARGAGALEFSRELRFQLAKLKNA